MEQAPDTCRWRKISPRFPERLAIHHVIAMLPFFRPFRKRIFTQTGPQHTQLFDMTMTRSDQTSDSHFMRMALDMAYQALRAEEVPVGAVLVQDGHILATGFNQREGTQDATAHAELIAIRSASMSLGSWRLTGTTLYVTLEPCAMCAGAIIQARIARVVFGTWDPKAGACGSICNLPAETRFNHRVAVDSDILAEECRAILQNFFQNLRRTQPVATA
jgi:tRNA(adenine34) deaminase